MKTVIISMIVCFSLVSASAEYAYIVSGTPTEPRGVAASSSPTEVTLALKTSNPSPWSDLEARGRTFVEMLLSGRFRSMVPTGLVLLFK